MTVQFIQKSLHEFLITPDFEPTREQLALLADCSVRTINYDVAMLNRLVPKEFQYVAGQEIFTHEQKRAILGVRGLFKKYRHRPQVEAYITRHGVPLA